MEEIEIKQLIFDYIKENLSLDKEHDWYSSGWIAVNIKDPYGEEFTIGRIDL